MFYRWRRRRTQRKAGNVADFCRRWGRHYRYMVVLDADSVMSGDCLITLVRLMEAHPQAGILQTAPQAWGHATLHARAQQFAARVDRPAVHRRACSTGSWARRTTGATTRSSASSPSCGTARWRACRAAAALSGELLSHDFVEAALMRRAGCAGVAGA